MSTPRHPHRINESGDAVDSEIEDPTDDGKSGFKLAVHHWVEYTGVHAVPNYFAAQRIFWKLYWLLIVLAGTAVCIWQVIVTLSR